MYDECTIWLSDEQMTLSAGGSLPQTLYTLPVIILLSGSLGAGKTTFARGVGKALGIPDPVTSPTFALEQRYHTERFGELLHLDLYRLSARDARALLHQSDAHKGMRIVEWPERIGAPLPTEAAIAIHFAEEKNGRRLTVEFRDIPLPDDRQIQEWRTDVHLPGHIARHCDAVADVADDLAVILLGRGMLVRRAALRAASRLHDLLRFVDFRPNAHPPQYMPHPGDESVWKQWKDLYPAMKHEPACAQFLTERGFAAVARIVEAHGLTLKPMVRDTIEQKILFYADKRVMVDHRVSLQERFDDFRERYAKNHRTSQAENWLSEAKKIERELFGDSPPM